MSPSQHDHTAIEIFGPAGASITLDQSNGQINLETNTVVTLDVIDLFSLPRGVEIDFPIAVRKIERLYHGISGCSDGPQPAYMAGPQQVDDSSPVMYFFFGLPHCILLTKKDGRITVAPSQGTIECIILSCQTIQSFGKIRLHIEKDGDLFSRNQAAAFHRLAPPHD